MSVLTFVNNAAGVPTPSTVSLTQHAVHAPGEPERQPRAVRAGQVDAEPADADLRRALRLLQRLAPEQRRPGGPLHVGGGSGGTRTSRRVMPAVLERLVDSRRRVLRSVRQRQDGAEDLGRQVPRRSRRSAWRRRSTRWPARPIRATWTDRRRQRHGLSMRRATSSSTSSGRRRNLNSRHSRLAARRFDPACRAPTNWEESVSVQHELFPRVSVTGGYYRRQFYNIQYTKNTLRWIRSPTSRRSRSPCRQRRTCPDGGGQVDHALQPESRPSRGRSTTSLTWSTNNTRVYNGFEVSVNARLPQGLHVRRHHDRADGHQQLHRSASSNPNNSQGPTRTTCGSATRRRRSRRSTRGRPPTPSRATSR